jgi:hypothetical protein
MIDAPLMSRQQRPTTPSKGSVASQLMPWLSKNIPWKWM